MQRKNLFLCSLIALFLLGGCTTSKDIENEDVSEATLLSEYSLSHGITSLDILTEHITYSESPIQIDYEFENGNMDVNIGMLLFLDGYLQPFSIDFSEEKAVMNIIDLNANSSKTVCISFDPIAGTAGQNLPLHIVVILDAKDTFPTSASTASFFQSLSQAYPVAIMFETDGCGIPFQNYYQPTFSIISNDGNISGLMDEQSNSRPELRFPQFSSINDILDKSVSFSLPINIELDNVSENEKQYNIFAFIDNTPVLWNGSPFLSISIPAKSQYSTDIMVDTTVDKTSSVRSRQLFLVAVPLHEADIQQETLVLKTKTIVLS